MKLIICAVLLFLSSQAFGATDKVVCYYASWASTRNGTGRFTPDDIEANLCTHINYAFLGLNPDGSLKILDQVVDITQGGFKKVSGLKSKNPSLKVLFSIGGAAADTGLFTSIATDPQKRAKLASSAIDFCKTYNFDGIDIDWEYPRGGDGQHFVDLLTAVKNAFKPLGYLVTVAVNSIPGEVGGYDIPGMSKVLDLINVMTYDFVAIWAGITAENAPLYGGKNQSSWQKENRNCNASITYWLQGGADPQKITIGLPFYGHHFVLSSRTVNGLNAPAGPGQPGPHTNNLGSLGYNEICEFHKPGTTVFLDDMQVPYLYDGNLWVGFDNPQSLAAKVKYAKDKKLGGVMIWSIDTDDLHGFCGQTNGLLKAVSKAIKS